MRLIKMVQTCAIVTCLIAPLFQSQPFAQAGSPFSTGVDDWPNVAPEAAKPQTPPATEPMPIQPEVKHVEGPKQQPAESQSKITQSSKPSSGVSESVKSETPVVERPAPTPSYSSESSSSTSSSSTSSSSPVKTSLKSAGPPRILVCRPVYAPYSEELKTMYLSSITEAYFHFKLNGIPGYQVISQERIANNVQYFRDFSRRLSRTTYIDAAQQLGAAYLFYVEYEPQGKKAKFNIEFYSIAENKKLLSSAQEIDLAQFEDGLFSCLNEVTSSLSTTLPNDVQQFLGSSILGKNPKAVENMGNLIASMGAYSKKRAEAVVSEYEKISKDNPEFHLAKMITASTCALAQQFDKAIKFQESLISSFGAAYPALNLQLATYYTLAGKYNDALDVAEKAQRTSELELLARTEKAHIYEAQGNLKSAKNEYQQVLSIGGEDGEIYFQLALVSIGLNDLSSSSNYLSKAESAGRKIDRGDYFNIGLRYKKLGTADEKAIEAFKNSLGIQKDKEDAWLQLAEIYSKTGREMDAAECYVNLFHINNSAYKDYLPKAGFKFESLGKVDRAREAYSLFIARRYSDPEVSLRLAKIELQSGNCAKATDLVRGMDTSAIYGPEVKKINQQCGVPERRVVVNADIGKQEGTAAVFMWRVMSGIVTIGGVGAGVYFNSVIDDKIAEYKKSKEVWDGNLLNQNISVRTSEIEKAKNTIDGLHSDIESFKLYRTVCYGAGGVGAGSLALSITLPIVIKK